MGFVMHPIACLTRGKFPQPAFRTGRDGKADSYAQARWHLRMARHWAAMIEGIGWASKRGNVRRYQRMVGALLEHIEGAAYWRELARWFRRMGK